MEIQIRNMSHFKAFGMINLQYEISICKILYNKGTNTNTSWYLFKCNTLYVDCRYTRVGKEAAGTNRYLGTSPN